jgi:hypothetical protein
VGFHFAWRLLYRRFAFLFDFAAGIVSGGKWMAWGRTSMNYLQGGRVLELAHGPAPVISQSVLIFPHRWENKQPSECAGLDARSLWFAAKRSHFHFGPEASMTSSPHSRRITF